MSSAAMDRLTLLIAVSCDATIRIGFEVAEMRQTCHLNSDSETTLISQAGLLNCASAGLPSPAAARGHR